MSPMNWSLPAPVTVSLSETATSDFEGAQRLALLHPLDDAEVAKMVQLVVEVGILNPAETLQFRIERGGLGYTRVTVTGLDGETETVLHTALWNGWSDALADGESGRNPFWFDVDFAGS